MTLSVRRRQPPITVIIAGSERFHAAHLLSADAGVVALQERRWITRNPASVPIDAFISASGYFEACITNVHRATECMKAIKRRRDVQLDVKQLLPKGIRFIQEPVAGRVRNMRDAIQHFEREILSSSGEVTNVMLVADGSVIERGEDKVKIINMLKIGDHQIDFCDLSYWLREMAKCAEVISRYRRPTPSKSPPEGQCGPL
jgi:hypothetical protein